MNSSAIGSHLFASLAREFDREVGAAPKDGRVVGVLAAALFLVLDLALGVANWVLPAAFDSGRPASGVGRTFRVDVEALGV